MENTHESSGMKRVYGLVKGLKTPTEQNLAAALQEAHGANGVSKGGIAMQTDRKHLPDVVRAHQQGIGRSAYRRQINLHARVIKLDGKYELRSIKKLFRDGRWVSVWSAWYVAGPVPFQVHDVCVSTSPVAVRDDLVAWIAGV
jgi:hypothetical protein